MQVKTLYVQVREGVRVVMLAGDRPTNIYIEVGNSLVKLAPEQVTALAGMLDEVRELSGKEGGLEINEAPDRRG